jgi:geranylgeranyl pyrophosphate synthase
MTARLTCMPQISYPRFLLLKRQEVNDRLRHVVPKAFPDRFLSRQVLDSVLPGRKVRSILFLETLHDLAPGIPSATADDVILSIELSHAASVLVDDVVDGDRLRHGAAATSNRWGATKSILFAHLLCSSALLRLEQHPLLQQGLLGVYRRMSLGEISDMLIPPGEWIYRGYDSRVFQKTSALFEFALASAGLVAGSQVRAEALAKLGGAVGLLYQTANDYHDWQPHNILKRHDASDVWPVTFSFPLALYLAKYGSRAIAGHLRSRFLPYSEWQRFLARIWQPDIRQECRRAIRKNLNDVLRTIKAEIKSASLSRLYRSLAQLIIQEGFWYHAYKVH